MHVRDLTDPKAIATTIVITHPSEPANEILYVHTHMKGKREQNDDGSWPPAATSPDDDGGLKSGVGITRYVLQDGKYTVDEVKEWPKKRSIQRDTVEETQDEADFMFWDEFAEQYADYEIISHPKNLREEHVA